MKKILSVLIFTMLVSLLTITRAGGQNSQLMVGTAIRDITPTKEMFPLTRKVDITLVGVLDPIHVRAIALTSGGATTLLICSETGRGPFGPQYAKAVADHTGLPLEAIFLTATHAHAAPEITERIDLYFETGTEITNQQRWGKYAMEQILAAADEALANLKPASVGIGYSESYINENRVDSTGPSDKSVAAIRFNDLKGKPVAFLINYAVHGVVMYANKSFEGQGGISSDISGMVSNSLEDKYRGSVAMWLSGAAGDQNPIGFTAAFKSKTSDSDPIKRLMYLSKIHLADIEKALSGIKEYSNTAKVNYNFMKSVIPAKDGGDYPTSLQIIRIGDIALVGFHGELFTSIGMKMKENSLLKNTIIVTHTWQRSFQEQGYHADDKSIASGGQGTNAKYKPGFLADELTSIMNTLIKDTNEWTFNGDGTATNNSSGKRVIVGLDNTPGSSDDNQIVNPAGKVLIKNASLSIDSDANPYVALGNGFNLYGGADKKIGTEDDVIKGFGRYPQSDTTGIKTDPLNWRILDIIDNKAVLASDVIVTGIKFNLKDGDGNSWSESNLRLWLNSKGGQDITKNTKGFYNSAFSEAERRKIVLSKVEMKSDTGFIAYNALVQKRSNFRTSGNETNDYVWTLSGEEWYKYFGISRIATKAEAKFEPVNFTNAYYIPSEYAFKKGVKINTGHNGPSFIGYGDVWTRSPGAETDGKIYYGVFLGSMGSLNSGRPVTRDYGTVPVLTVKLNK